MSVKSVSLKVTPRPSLRVADATEVPFVSLLETTPIAMVGAERVPPIIGDGVQPSTSSCFGPRGAALMRDGGPLWVCDTGHHRLLGWRTAPSEDLEPADWVIGQPDFSSEGRNGKAAISATSVNVPTGICPLGEGMAVADAWNHRVLVWHSLPEDSHVPADIVLGQEDFISGESNQGKNVASASSFHWPYGVTWANGHLYVSDSDNRRVLIWKGVPHSNNQPADLVLGQATFEDNDENAGGEPTSMSMCWPHSVALWGDRICVADAGNNRIMVWNSLPSSSGTPCDYVLGQTDYHLSDHNQSLYWPRANTLNMPYALAANDQWLIAADTANSRVIAWHVDDLETGCAARALFAQQNFHDKGDNRWLPVGEDTICWPYGIQLQGDTLVLADSGNNRVSLWKLNV